MRRLLLDFGGVVIKTPFEMVHRIGSPPWFGPFDPKRDELWAQMQNGLITERQYWHTRAKGQWGDAEDPLMAMFDQLFAPPPDDVVRPEVLALIADYPAAVLTNDLGRFHPPEWLDAMGLAGVFEPLIDLSDTTTLKPHPRSYARALEVLGEAAEGALHADSIVFVDDQPGNIAGAEASGIPSIWFDVTDPAGSVERVRTALA